MTVVTAILLQILHIGLIIGAAPTAAAILDWLDTRLAGRTGAPIWQPWHDLLRLSRKTPPMSESVSAVSSYAPAVGLGAVISAATLVPSFTLGMALGSLADVLVIVGLLTVARVARALTAFDSGAALPGVAQQRASMLAVFAEPALMLAVITPALIGGSCNLDVIAGQQRDAALLPATAWMLAVASVLAANLQELCSDGHDSEEMEGGPTLAMAWMTRWLCRVVWINLTAALFLPAGIAIAGSGPIGWAVGLAAWAIKSAFFLLAIAAMRTVLRPAIRGGLTERSGLAVFLALLAIIVVLASTGMT